MASGERTFVIGDIHGDSAALERLLALLPPAERSDTVVFLGDYVDRGPDARGVVERVRRFVQESDAHVVTLRGNHEDKWLQSWEKPDLPFLVQWANGCGATYRSFTGGAPLGTEESLATAELQQLIDVRGWFPAEVMAWMEKLPLWHEDEHALYVHAGLDRDEAGGWKHPRDSQPKPLLWMREPAFFKHYRGKRVVFGHTPVADLPVERQDAAPADRPWSDHDLVGIDTGCGRGGPLTAVELPALRFYQSPPAQ